jgi:hypothetical protein
MAIPAEGSLDAITVFWQDFGPSRGAVTIICWGSAWTCYFGGMSGNSIKEFFAGANTSYLVKKLGITRWLKSSKAHEQYLGRIIDAVKGKIQ